MSRPLPPAPLHVAFVTEFDVSDQRSYSGTPQHMLAALRRHVEQVSVVGPLPVRRRLAARVGKLRARVAGRDVLLHHTAHTAHGLAEAAAPALRRLRPDFVLSPGSLPLAFLDVPFPLAFWPDATFESNLLFHDTYARLTDESVLEGHRVEEAALARAALALYPSERAFRSAVSYYGTPAERVHLVRYGANLDPAPEAAAVEAAIDARQFERLTLLYVGTDWVRKGGDVAVRVVEALNRRGRPAELVVVGSAPRLDRPRADVRATGFLSKADPAARARLYALYAQSHFFCAPVRNEAFGCAFAEAAAFGLPSLATAVGGVPTVLGEGPESAGFLFPAGSDPLAIADRVAEVVASADGYRARCRAARARFERLLSWDTNVREVVCLMTAHLDRRPAGASNTPAT